MPGKSRKRVIVVSLIGIVVIGVAVGWFLLVRLVNALDRAKAADSLRSLGQAMLLYTNDTKGEFPSDLGTLAAREDITPVLFIDPSSDTVVPGNLSTLADIANWVNANSDFVYLGAHFNLRMNPATVVAYEKPRKDGGTNVLFLDGHVLFYGPEATRLIIGQLKAGTNPPDWKAIPDQGRHIGLK